MEFNPETALRYACALARPRRVGSSEDERVAREISAMLERFGYRVERQPFTFSNLVNLAITLELGLSLTLIAFGLWDSRLAPWLATALLAILLLFPGLSRLAEAASLSETPKVFKTFGVLKTANIIATQLNASTDLPQLYLVAHYDSKSQRLPIVVRVVLFVIFISSGLMFAVLALFGVRVPGLNPAAAAIGGLTLVAGVPLLLFATEVGNESAGAIDNASGMGLVLHLAECLAHREDIRITILITSAEEWATLGAAAYVRAHEAELRRETAMDRLYVLNFDGIGVAGELHYVAARRHGRLLDLVREACAELNLPLKKFWLVGALFDHMPFAARGFDALSLITIGQATLAVHTARDAADKLDVRGFEQAGRAALKVVEKLAALN
jgi:hypothetical protein